ncbi:MAG: hypothetical protein HFG80_01135 [Eubacterium sp.]|nr:hypothetical protein [Eubacterium sp.]
MNDDLYQKENPTVPKEWPDSYYDVEDIDCRLELLKKHMEQTESTQQAENVCQEKEADKFREKLFLSRYTKKNGQYVDRYVADIYRLRMLAAEPPGMFGKKSARREVNEILETLCCGGDMESAPEKELYFLELKHAVRVYIGICKRDKQYGSIILGQGRKKPTVVLSKIVQDFENITRGLPTKLQLEKNTCRKMQYLKEAIAEAFHEEEPNEDYWYQYLQK